MASKVSMSFVDLVLMLLEALLHGKVKREPLHFQDVQEEQGSVEVQEEDPGPDHVPARDRSKEWEVVPIPERQKAIRAQRKVHSFGE